MLKRKMFAKATLCVALLAWVTACSMGDDTPPSLGIGPGERDVYLIGYSSSIILGAIETGPEIRIELFRDGLGGASEIIGVFPRGENFWPWTPTGPTSENCVFKATDTSYPALTAVSGVFRIVGPGLYVQGPHLFDPRVPGDRVYVDWHGEAASQASITDVRIELTRDGGVTWEEIAASMPVSAGFYAWIVTDGGLPLPQPDCQFRVTDLANPSTSDVSLPFSIE